MWASGAVRAITRRLNSLRATRPSNSRLVVAGMVLMMVLATAGFLVGRGESALRVQVRPGDAWLPTDKNGSINLIDGLSGRSSAALVLKGASGDRLVVIQVGGRVLVLDATTGLLVRIDPVELLLGASLSLQQGSVVVAGLAATYVVDYGARTVQRIDPVTLKPIGPAISLRWQPAGTAIVDRQGTLWVPVPAIGSVVPVTDSGVGGPVKVSAVGANVVMTSANGVPIAVDRTGRRLTVIGLGGVAEHVLTLPASVGLNGPKALLVSAAGSQSSLPMVNPNGSPSLVIVNLASDTTTSAQLGAEVTGHRLGAPVQAGQRIFIPDFTTGEVLVYDTSIGQVSTQIPVLGHAGVFTAEVIDGIAYFNDPNGNRAVVVTPDGQVHDVTKNGPHVPVVRSVAPPQTTPTPVNTRQPGPSPSPTPGHGKGHHKRHHKPKAKPSPTKSKSPKPTPKPTPTPTPTPTKSSTAPPPLAPVKPQATAGAGFVDVTWQPPTSGGPVASYQVTVTPSAGTQTSTGPTSVQFTGLTCGTKYSFTVSSVGTDGKSVPAAPVTSLSCLAPGPPQGLNYSVSPHQITLTWSAPASNGGGTVSYAVSLNNGSATAATSPDTITNLTNFQTYSVSVIAVNGAGNGGSMSAQVPLSAGPWGYQTWNTITLNVRAQPNTGSASLGTFPGPTPVSIVCQVAGGAYYEPGSGVYRGNIWDEIQYGGGVAYIGDFYTTTPNAQSMGFSWPPLWAC